jgi:hypothetical protein
MGTAHFAFAQTSHVSFEKSPTHSPTHAFNVQLKKTLDQIRKDIKTGTLTQAQARVMMEKAKVIRIQELQLLKDNDSKVLTSNQITQLTAQLNTLQSEL